MKNTLLKAARYVYYWYLSLASIRYGEEPATVRINGIDIHYVTRGPRNGKPVLLLHGNGGSHKSLRTQAMQLARAGYRVYSPDSRGQGANAPLNEYHYSDMMEDTCQFIKVMGLDKPAVFGWSDGGIIALMLEVAYPGTCGPMAVAGANLKPDCGPGFEEFKTWILEQGTPLALMMLSEPDIEPESLSVIKCPTLVCCGSEDLISVEHTRLISDSIPGSELVVVEGRNHGNYIKRSPIMGRMLLGFLKRNNYDTVTGR